MADIKYCARKKNNRSETQKHGLNMLSLSVWRHVLRDVIGAKLCLVIIV
jgi:hypothetical protein